MRGAGDTLQLSPSKQLDIMQINACYRYKCEPWFSMGTDLAFARQIPPQYILNGDETPFGAPVVSPYVVSPINSPETLVVAKEDHAGKLGGSRGDRPVRLCTP